MSSSSSSSSPPKISLVQRLASIAAQIKSSTPTSAVPMTELSAAALAASAPPTASATSTTAAAPTTKARGKRAAEVPAAAPVAAAAAAAAAPAAKKAKKVAKKDLPHVLLWLCHHGLGQSKTWTQKRLRVVGVYASKQEAEARKAQIMAQYENCGYGDICVGDTWEDEIDLLVRPCEECTLPM